VKQDFSVLRRMVSIFGLIKKIEAKQSKEKHGMEGKDLRVWKALLRVHFHPNQTQRGSYHKPDKRLDHISCPQSQKKTSNRNEDKRFRILLGENREKIEEKEGKENQKGKERKVQRKGTFRILNFMREDLKLGLLSMLFQFFL